MGRGAGPPREVTRRRRLSCTCMAFNAYKNSVSNRANWPSCVTSANPLGRLPLMQAAADEARRARERDTLLLRASSIGDVASVERLLGEGASGTTACDQRRATALHLAAARGHADVVELLAAHGCDVDAEDEAGRTGASELLSMTQLLFPLCADSRLLLPCDTTQSCTWRHCVPRQTWLTCSSSGARGWRPPTRTTPLPCATRQLHTTGGLLFGPCSLPGPHTQLSTSEA